MAVIKETFRLIDQASGPMKQIEAAGIKVTIVLQQMGTAAKASADVAAAGAKEISEEAGKATSKVKGLSAAWKSLKNVAIFTGGIALAKNIMQAADQQSTLNARIRMMNDGLQTTEQLQRMIYKSAQKSRGSYASTAEMVGKFGTLAPDAFNSSAEVVNFAEQINKHLALSGASGQAGDAAILQLTQALGSGVLRGEELNSVLEQTPTIAQAIAQYMGTSVGEMRKLASEGQITADVVKNALFATADETNAKFEQMPMTFSQVWQKGINAVQQAAIPVLNAIAKGATFIHDNWSTISPVLFGIAAALGVMTAAQLAQATATAIQKAAQDSLNASLLASPTTWIALGIGLLVGLIYKWIQSVGGLSVAWLIAKNYILTAWDAIQIGIQTGVNAVMNFLGSMVVMFASAGTNIANFVGDMKVNVLTILQNMVNGAIDLLNNFIDTVNKIPGVAIDTIDHVTFATTASASNEAEKAARNADLERLKSAMAAQEAERAANLAKMKAEAKAAETERLAGIASAKAEAQAAGEGGEGLGAGIDPYGRGSVNGSGGSGDVGSVGNVGSVGSVKNIEGDVKLSDEDMKIYRDLAERRYMNNVELQTLAPNITVTLGQGANAQNLKPKDVANAIAMVLAEQQAAHTAVSHA